MTEYQISAFLPGFRVSCDEFTARRMTRQLDYNWDVEQDAMVWETAVGSMATIKRKLKELRDLEDEPDA